MNAPAHKWWIFRFRQFSLRTGAFLFLTIGIAFGLAGRWIHNIRQRGNEQLRFVQRCNDDLQRGALIYAPETKVDRFTTLVRKWVHPEYNRKFSEMMVSSTILEAEPPIDLSQMFGADYIHVSYTTKNIPAVLSAFQIPNVKSIEISYRLANVTQTNDFSSVAQARDLESLDLSTNYASIELLAELEKLQKLRRVLISNCPPEGLIRLASAPSLEDLCFSLYLSGDPREPLALEDARSAEDSLKIAFDKLANGEKLSNLQINHRLPITPASIAKFCAKSQLKSLALYHTGSAPACLTEFAKLPALRVVTIKDELLTDTHLGCVGKRQL